MRRSSCVSNEVARTGSRVSCTQVRSRFLATQAWVCGSKTPFMKNWEHRERAREVLSREVGYVRKPHGGRQPKLELRRE